MSSIYIYIYIYIYDISRLRFKQINQQTGRLVFRMAAVNVYCKTGKEWDQYTGGSKSQGDTRLTLTPSVIPNSNYVIMVSD
jgi:hypothetical protein